MAAEPQLVFDRVGVVPRLPELFPNLVAVAPELFVAASTVFWRLLLLSDEVSCPRIFARRFLGGLATFCASGTKVLDDFWLAAAFCSRSLCILTKEVERETHVEPQNGFAYTNIFSIVFCSSANFQLK